jgi:hypothetical protein
VILCNSTAKLAVVYSQCKGIDAIRDSPEVRSEISENMLFICYLSNIALGSKALSERDYSAGFS